MGSDERSLPSRMFAGIPVPSTPYIASGPDGVVKWLYTITKIGRRKWSIVAVTEDKVQTLGWRTINDLVIHRAKAETEEEARDLLLAKIDPNYAKEIEDVDPF